MKNIFKKIGAFCKKHKTKILLFTLMIVILAGLSIGVYFLLRYFGITDANHLKELVEETGAWGWVVFILLQVVITTVMCFIPGTTMIFIGVGYTCFGPWKAMIIVSTGVLLSSMAMFFIGDKCGERVVIKIVGDEAFHKAQDAINIKSKILLPLMLMFPGFPDDALCLVAGMTKMKYWHFAIIVLIFRSIGVIAFCLAGYGVSFIDYHNFTPIEWVICINLVLIDAYFIWKIIRFIERKVTAYQAKKEEEKNVEVEE